jgi:hexosaminidase
MSLQSTVWAAPLNIIPKPVRCELQSGTFAFAKGTAVIAGNGAEQEALVLVRDLNTLAGRELAKLGGPRATKAVSLELDSSLSGQLGTEGYLLRVTPERVQIRAAAEAGLSYGGVTLRQLLEPAESTDWRIPCLEITDRPRFTWRGLLIDVGRHYMPLPFLKKAVDLVALHKMNMLQLHLTDDQGWRVEIKKYPRLTEIGSIRKESPRKGAPQLGDGTPYGPFFYTQAELRELVAYAATRHVTIVPEIEMPGHFLAALAAYPQFSCRGGPLEVRTRWGVEPDILCAGNDGSLEFAKDILAEVLDIFPSRFIHIGGDEAPRDRWRECPKCQGRIKAEGLKNEAQLQTYFNHVIENFLTTKGRRLIGWDEILEGGLTPGAAVMSWRGITGGIAAASAGHDVVMSPTSHCYFDYAQSQAAGEPQSIGGFIPLERVYQFEPVPAELPAEKRRHILGAQGNVWTEFLHTPADVEYSAFPRAAALAEVLWTPAEARDFEGFKGRLRIHEKRLQRLNVNYRPLDRP